MRCSIKHYPALKPVKTLFVYMHMRMCYLKLAQNVSDIYEVISLTLCLIISSYSTRLYNHL